MLKDWKRTVIGDTVVYTAPSKEYVDKKLEESTMNNAQNYAPKEIEGNYLVTIKGNKVSVARAYVKADLSSDHKTYRCHPDDKFDLMECIKMYNEPEQIKAGDVVNIINRGDCYDMATDVVITMANRHPEKRDRILIGWNKGKTPVEYLNARVIDTEPHPFNKNILLCLVEMCDSYYLMSSEGLEKVK